MSYKKQNFYANQTLKAEHLNNIESGIVANEMAIAERQPKGDYLTEHQKIKTINGQNLVGEGDVEIKASRSRICSLKDGEYNILTINHRGYSKEAPENTIPAYILSKQKGYNYVECDVSFTADGVAVLLHDETIDRTSNGSGNISQLTYQQVLQYDFGSWFSTKYAGTKIPSFSEFIKYCKGLGLHPYIELKSNGGYTSEQIGQIVNEVELCGMKGRVTYISFSATFLGYVKEHDPQARLGYIADITSSTIAEAVALKTGENEVFMDVNYTYITNSKISSCAANDLPVEV
jgi:glycerophosphoryl diester phosphodiesterase